MPPIGERLKTLMSEQKISAIQLAKLAQVKPSFIYDIIHGKSANPSVVKLSRVAEGLGVDVSALLGKQTAAKLDAAYDTPSFQHAASQGFMEKGSSQQYATISSVIVEAGARPDQPFVLKEETGKSYQFHKSWLKEKLGVKESDLRMITVRGDSMSPSLLPGDVVLIDISTRTPTPPGLFALFDGAGLAIKRLEFIANSKPASMRVMSDNPQYAPFECAMDELRILGRIVWFARQL